METSPADILALVPHRCHQLVLRDGGVTQALTNQSGGPGPPVPVQTA